MVNGYIAAVPNGTPAVRFTYEPVAEAEAKALRDEWRPLDQLRQDARISEFLASRLGTLEVLSNRPPVKDKDGNLVTRPPREAFPVTPRVLLEDLPKGIFARVVWIVLGVHESDPDPDAPTAPAAEPPAADPQPETK